MKTVWLKEIVKKYKNELVMSLDKHEIFQKTE